MSNEKTPDPHESAQRDQLLQAAIDFIGTLTGLKPPPIEVAPPEVFAPFYAFVERVQEITRAAPVPMVVQHARASADRIMMRCLFPEPDAVTREQLTAIIEGMSVSVDVSTGDHDASHRYFGTVTEVMEDAGDKHGVTLLVQDAKPNFEPQAVAAQAAPVAVAVPECERCGLSPAEHDLMHWCDNQSFRHEDGTVQMGATPALPATEDSSAGDLAEVQAEPVAVLKGAPYEPTSAMLIEARRIEPALPFDAIRAIWWAMWRKAPQAEPVMFINPKVIDKSTGKIAPGTGALTHADSKRGGWTFPVYAAPQAQPADALDDGPVAPNPMYEDSWTHWAYAQAPSTATIDAAMAAAQPCRYTLDQGLPLLQKGQENDYGTCTIDVTMAAAQEGGNAAKEA